MGPLFVDPSSNILAKEFCEKALLFSHVISQLLEKCSGDIWISVDRATAEFWPVEIRRPGEKVMSVELAQNSRTYAGPFPEYNLPPTTGYECV